MAKGDRDVPELVRAAEGLENELVRLEELSRSVRKMRLNSDKSIARAAKELSDALALPGRLAEGLTALAGAMERMQARQQAALEPLTACAADVHQRMQRLGEHMQAFAALGKAAGEASALLHSEGERGAGFEGVEAQLTQIADGARSLSDAARADDFPDIAREADALRQRVTSLRGRLKGKG